MKKINSGQNQVVLKNVTHSTDGLYKCEAVADFPSFEKDYKMKKMQIIGKFSYVIGSESYLV